MMSLCTTLCKLDTQLGSLLNSSLNPGMDWVDQNDGVADVNWYDVCIDNPHYHGIRYSYSRGSSSMKLSVEFSDGTKKAYFLSHAVMYTNKLDDSEIRELAGVEVVQGTKFCYHMDQSVVGLIEHFHESMSLGVHDEEKGDGATTDCVLKNEFELGVLWLNWSRDIYPLDGEELIANPINSGSKLYKLSGAYCFASKISIHPYLRYDHICVTVNLEPDGVSSASLMLDSDMSHQYLLFSGNIDIDEVIEDTPITVSMAFGGSSVINGTSQMKGKFYSLLFFSDLVNDYREFCIDECDYKTTMDDSTGKVYIDWECGEMNIFPGNNVIHECATRGCMCFVKDIRESGSLVFNFDDGGSLKGGYKLNASNLGDSVVYILLDKNIFYLTNCNACTSSQGKYLSIGDVDIFSLIDSFVCSVVSLSASCSRKNDTGNIVINWNQGSSARRQIPYFFTSGEFLFSKSES